MRKNNNYLHYILAIFFPIFSSLSQGYLFKPGIIKHLMLWFFLLYGLSRLVEWLLTLSDHLLVRWGGVLLGCTIYIVAFICFDDAFLGMTMVFTGFQPWSVGLRLLIIVVVYTIFFESNKWASAREKAKIEHIALQTENIETKYKLLREQVNPEFLFYCLNTLKAMVRVDNPQTEGYILKLADVYRQTLNTDRNIVSLREELGLLQTYMFLMRSNRESEVSFEVEVMEESLPFNIPVFSLQLLGNNCIKHNVFSASKPLHIRLFQLDERSITMTNNYQKKENPDPFGMDIDHLEMRYALEGIENGVHIEKGLETYTITLKLI